MRNYFLYAEDDQDDADILEDMLQVHKGLNKMVHVANGYELLQFLQGIKANATFPCLIILDFHLPRLNGLETLQLLKTDDLYRLIPVVMLTSKATHSNEADCKKLGAEVLIKPNDYLQWKILLSRLALYIDEE